MVIVDIIIGFIVLKKLKLFLINIICKKKQNNFGNNGNSSYNYRINCFKNFKLILINIICKENRLNTKLPKKLKTIFFISLH